MEGQEFEEDSTLWKIMEVKWDEEQGQFVVLYFDVQGLEDHGLTECDLEEDAEGAVEYRSQYVEWSSLNEVKTWLRASNSKK